MKNYFILVFIFAITCSNLLAQQQCKFLEEFAFYDYENKSSSRDKLKMSLHFLKQIKEDSYETAKSRAGNLSIPIEDIIVGAGYQDARSEYKKFRQELLEHSLDYMTDKIISNSSTHTLNIGMIDVLNTCIKQLPDGFTPLDFYHEDNENLVIVKLIYNNKHQPGEIAKIKVKSISPSNAINPNGVDWMHSKDSIFEISMFHSATLILERNSCNGFVINFEAVNGVVFENTYLDIKKTCPDIDTIEIDDKLPECPQLKIVALNGKSKKPKKHPSFKLKPKDTHLKIISGGARILKPDGKTEYDELMYLTASYPDTIDNAWVAKAKDHGNITALGIIEVFALAIVDNNNEWDVKVKEKHTKVLADYPQIELAVDDGYVLTGGGTEVVWQNNEKSAPGNIITASYPSSNYTWFSKSKEHIEDNKATITGYLIQIKPKKQCKQTLESRLFQNEVNNKKLKTAKSQVNGSWKLTGGGAFAHWTDLHKGSLLVASYPKGKGWVAKSAFDDLAPLTSYSIGLRFR